jgi:hypothetical protein
MVNLFLRNLSSIYYKGGNNPGIQRFASVAGNAHFNGDFCVSEIRIPFSINIAVKLRA